MGRHRLAIASFLGALALAAPAAAQDVAAAEALFNRGLTDMKEARFETGCPALGESYRLDPRPGTLFTLAECEAKRGRIATAVTRYGDYLALFARLPHDAQAKQKGREKIAAEKKALLAPAVPELTLALPPDAPRGTVVKRDDAVLADAALGIALPIDPGEHLVTTQAPGGQVTELRITVAQGEKKRLTLQVKGAPPTENPPPFAASPSVASTPDTSMPRRQIGAYVVRITAMAGLGLGAIMGGLAIGEKVNKVDSACDKNFKCSHDGKLAVDRARTFALVSTIGFSVGIAGIATAVVLRLTEPSSSSSARVVRRAPAPKMRVGVWAAGNEGTAVGVQGVW